MKIIIKKFSFLFITAVIIVSMTLPLFAQGNVTFNANTKDFIFKPGSDKSPTDLFTSFKDVMPGDKLTDSIKVVNEKVKDVKIKLYVRALDTSMAEESDDEFLSKLKLTVKQNGDSVLFDAPANEEAQLKDWVYLGTIYSGGEITLDLTLDVPEELNNEYMNTLGYVDWEFKADELPVEKDDPKPPQTNDNTDLTLYIGLAVVSALIIITVVITACGKKRTTQS
ncbi:MAG: hypothetical protein E7652_00610 [Ruminococcaceae bacterium]|nr:hypothetical protein [Oscillospiraceae bacterium]